MFVSRYSVANTEFDMILRTPGQTEITAIQANPTPDPVAPINELLDLGCRDSDTSPGTFAYIQLDEVGVWDKWLTANEVDALWNGGDGLTYNAADPTPTATFTHTPGPSPTPTNTPTETATPTSTPTPTATPDYSLIRSSDIVINEVCSNPVTTDNAPDGVVNDGDMAIELRNLSDETIPLSGLRLCTNDVACVWLDGEIDPHSFKVYYQKWDRVAFNRGGANTAELWNYGTSPAELWSAVNLSENQPDLCWSALVDGSQEFIERYPPTLGWGNSIFD